MKKTVLLDEVGDAYRILLERIEGGGFPHDYGIPRQAWRRSVRFMHHFGADQALDVIDQRAEWAANRGDYDTARRWRDLIAAIHAIQEDDHLPGDSVH